MPRQPAPLICSDKPPYDWATKFLPVLFIAALLIGGIILIRHAFRPGVTLLVESVAFGLIFHFLIPRRYELFTDRLRIVLGRPFHWDIPLSAVAAARPARRARRWVFWGVGLATSSGTLVEIVRKKGWNVILSPSNRDAFLGQLNEALNKSRRLSPVPR